MFPSFREEKKLQRRGFKLVAGLDEAGRGPLAGPVVASAVVLERFRGVEKDLAGVKDSKQLSAERREDLYKILTKHPNIKWGIGIVSEKVIDKVNIFEATKLAMQKAVANLRTAPDFLILDGRMAIKTEIPQESIIKADAKVFSCAAASVLAKVTRDRIMLRYHKRYPKYGFDVHKGYPTKSHFKLLEEYGPCKIHRKSFRPVKSLAY
jgi:ribonuclease HII